MLLPKVMPLERLLVAVVVEQVYSTPSDVRTVTSFMLAATIVPVILLAPPFAVFPERPLVADIFPDAEKVVLVPFWLVDVPFVDGAGVAVGVSEAAAFVSDGVGVIAIAVESSSFFPHPLNGREKMPRHKMDKTISLLLFFMICSLGFYSVQMIYPSL